ncbi:MAG: FG-GAP-like repeat-containing protein [Planctomycetota bacterium]|nr:FG-GAP-like repeat-containing protein [Planctomycetota bacterium]
MMHRTVLPAVALALCSTASPAQTLVRSLNGPAAGAQFGKACLVVPDQNGDGFKDLLIGAPNFNGGRGAVYCVSGAFLSNGTGTSILATIAPPTSPGDQFGFSLANVGDLNLDGHADFVVGEPGFDGGGMTDTGAVRLLLGTSLAVLPERHWIYAGGRFGTAVAAASDMTGDGRREVAVGAPAGSVSFLVVLKAEALLYGGAATPTVSHTQIAAGGELGTSLASGFDFNGDGFEELIIGAPGTAVGSATGSGAIYIQSIDPNNSVFRPYQTSLPGERLGQSVSFGQDFDGDGAPDIVVGAPNSLDIYGHQVGRIVVLSGRRVFDQTPPYEIHTLTYGNVLPPANHADPVPNFHLGAAVLACPDLNGDGVGEILAGAPGYFTPGSISGFNFRGLARIYSGSSGARLASITGSSTDRLGDGLAGAVFDFDADGFKEFALAGSLSDAGGTDSGVLRAYRLFPLAPSIYCQGKINSLGCTPAIGFNGTPSESSGAAFVISASSVINQKNGLLFYSQSPTSVPFQGGTKCVATPNLRTASQSSGGSATGTDCSGAFSLDFSAWMASGVDPSLVAGAEVFAQFWSRDPASPSHTSLSNALRFVINP